MYNLNGSKGTVTGNFGASRKAAHAVRPQGPAPKKTQEDICTTVRHFKGRGVRNREAVSGRSPSDVRGEGRIFSGRAAPAGLVAGVDILGPATAPREPSPGVIAPRRCVQEQGEGGVLTWSSEAGPAVQTDGEREGRAAGQVPC